MGKIIKFEKEFSGNIDKANIEKAQEIIWDTWDMEDPVERVALAREALEVDPDCTDAYNLLGYEEDEDRVKRLEYFTQAIASFKKRHNQKYFDEMTGCFWGEPETRPFMRALLGYGQSLWAITKYKEAIETLSYMLILNPMDNQGVRHALVSWFLIVDDCKSARKLLKDYKEQVACMVFSALLLNILEQKDEKVIQKWYNAAVKANEYIVPYLLKKRKVPATDSYACIFGSIEEEAVSYMVDLYGAEAWISHPEALKVLAKLAKEKRQNGKKNI
jgi:tetratricopeptide (TPR) repeat protein